MKLPIIAGVIALASYASAIQSVVPNAFAGTEGPGTFALTSTGAAGRTFMMVIDESQLTSMSGTNLTGMQFRLNGGATWPATAASMSFFNIWVGAGVDPTAMSNTFADNFTGSSTQVRSGAITFNPGDFPSGGTPNGFGVSIDFNSSSYTYNGGDLAILMRFSQQTGLTTQSPLDAIAASDPGNGWGTLFSSRWIGDANGTTGNNANFLITQLTGEPVPEPATMIALSLGAAALLRRKKK